MLEYGGNIVNQTTRVVCCAHTLYANDLTLGLMHSHIPPATIGRHFALIRLCLKLDSSSSTNATWDVVSPKQHMRKNLGLFEEENFDSTVETKVTGYSIYNAEQRRRTKRNDLPELYPDLPSKKYSVIYADPPWDYNGKMQYDRSGRTENIDPDKGVFISAAQFKYPTLRLEELRRIPIIEICEDDCLLFMWTSSPHLKQAIELGESWGFSYRTVAFVWDKMCHNPGQYTLSNCEICLVFKRGRIPQPRGVRNAQQLVRKKRGLHSEKPAEVRQRIELMFPSQDKIELFARHKPVGWDVWGLDVREEFEQNSVTIGDASILD